MEIYCPARIYSVTYRYTPRVTAYAPKPRRRWFR